MIEKFGVQCDTCKNYESLGDMPLRDKVSAIKRRGWRIYRKATIWCHACPDCIEYKKQEQGRYWWQEC